MTRIFSDKYQYKKILPSFFHEGEFEELIFFHAPSLYPDYHVIPFKQKVVSPYGNAKPDLVFIAKDYRDWYVVEVEMAYHSFDSHVEVQIQKLTSAYYYEDRIIKYIRRKCKAIEKDRLSKLLHDEPGKMLLIMNEFNDEWSVQLENKYGALTSVFNVFCNGDFGLQIQLPDKAFLVDYNYPIYSLADITKCSVHPHYPYLGIMDNSILNIRPNENVTLEFNDCVTFWKAIRTPGYPPIWLRATGRDDFVDKRKEYQITKLRDSTLLLRAI